MSSFCRSPSSKAKPSYNPIAVPLTRVGPGLVTVCNVILYSLCIGNFLSPPMQWLHLLYEKPSPYDWMIFLTLLCIVTVPFYALTTAM